MSASDQKTDNESLQNDFLQISHNLLDCFPRRRPPVDIYHLDENTASMKLFAVKQQILPPEQREKLAPLCDEGRLFLSRDDYRDYATFLSGNLGLVLVEDTLDNRDCAEIFHQSMTSRLEVFMDQPVAAHLEAIEAALVTMSEYLWANPCRAEDMARHIRVDYNLASHGVNTLFIGLGMYILFFREKIDKPYLSRIGLGLLLHDVGMSKIPTFITSKASPLYGQDKESVRQHPEIGMNILHRLNRLSPEVKSCIAEHHERLDGSGYPNRLTAKDISLAGKICAIADSFCAMLAERPFRPAMPAPKAAMLILKDPKRFDTRLTKGLVTLVAKGLPFCRLQE